VRAIKIIDTVAKCFYLNSYFSLQNTLKLSKFSILKQIYFLTFRNFLINDSTFFQILVNVNLHLEPPRWVSREYSLMLVEPATYLLFCSCVCVSSHRRVPVVSGKLLGQRNLCLNCQHNNGHEVNSLITPLCLAFWRNKYQFRFREGLMRVPGPLWREYVLYQVAYTGLHPNTQLTIIIFHVHCQWPYLFLVTVVSNSWHWKLLPNLQTHQLSLSNMS